MSLDVISYLQTAAGGEEEELRTIKIAGLNIAMHQPHSPERYVDLMHQAYRSRHIVKLGKLHAAMLGSLYSSSEKHPRDGTPIEMTGEVYRFVKLDPNEPWFNTETKDVASEEDVQKIAIPRNLLPHLQLIPFIFRPRRHHLAYVSRERGSSLGPRTAEAFFQSLFDYLRTKKEFPQVEVTPLVDKDVVDEMLELKTLEKLTIELKRPNPDDLGHEDERWMKKLEKMKARKLVEQIEAVRGESIVPDAETRSIARVAANNGRVSVVARDATGARFEESTVARPLVITEHVDDKVETTVDVLRRTDL